MKKFYCIATVLIMSCFTFQKSQPFNSIRMSLSLNKNKDQWGSDIIDKNLAQYVSILEKLMDAQKKRKLTIEEMSLGYYAFMYIFSTQYIQYAGKVSITLDDKNTLNLPFSSEILMNLFTTILEAQNTQEK